MVNLETLKGNDALRKRLRETVAEGRVSHAYILEGPEGVGKMSIALGFASALLCTSGSGIPCGSCAHCLKTSHPDISIIEGEGKSGAVKISAIRALRSDAYIKPNEAERKVYIIDHAETMRAEAQNALLKIFEEPPSYAVILLLTSSLPAILPTLRSRAVTLSVRPLTVEETVGVLKKLSKKKEAELLAAAELSGGCVGHALALLSDKSAKEASTLADEFIGALSRELYHILTFAPRIGKSRELFTAFLARVYQLMAAQASLTNTAPLHIMEKISEIRTKLDGNVNLSLLAHCFCIDCWEATH